MEKGWTNDESKLTEQPHKLGLEKATPLCYAAFPSRLCGTLSSLLESIRCPGSKRTPDFFDFHAQLCKRAGTRFSKPASVLITSSANP
jgi:hypothetical protein